MKNRFLLPTLTLLLSLVFSLTTQAENILNNSSFEDYDVVSGDNVDWDPRGPDVTIARVGSPVQDGANALLVDNRTAAFHGARYVLNLIPDQVYRISGYGRMAAAGTDTLKVQVIVDNNGGSPVNVTTVSINESGWGFFDAFFSIPGPFSTTVLSFGGLVDVNAAFLLDNLSLVEGSGLLLNGDIESDLGASNWTARGSVVLDRIPSPVFEGSSALEVTDRAGQAFSGARQSLLGRLTPGVNYRLSGYVRLVSGATADDIEIRLVKAGAVTGEPNLATLAGVTDVAWVRFSTAFSIEDGLTQLDLSVRSVGGGAISDYIMDGFTLVEEDNLLNNPDFESGSAEWYNRGAITFTTVSSPVSSGMAAVQVTGRTSGFHSIAQDIDANLTSGSKYRVSGDLILNSGELDTEEVKVQVIIDGNGGAPVNLALVDTTAAGYTSFSTTFTASFTTDLDLSVGAITTSSDVEAGLTGFTLDNFSLEPITTILVNPGFESPIDTDTGEGWDPRGSVTLTPISSPVTEGTTALQVTGRTAGFNGVQQNLLGTLTAETNYRISGDVQLVGSASETVQVQLLKNDGAGPITGISDSGGTVVGTTATYNLTGLAGSASGTAAAIDVVRDVGGTITSVTLVDGGSGFAAAETITIVGSLIGGVDVTDDLTVTVDAVSDTLFQTLATTSATDTGWASFSSEFSFSDTGMTSLNLSIHGPASGVDLLVDNVALEKGPYLVNPSFEDIPVVADGIGWDQRGATVTLTQVTSPTPDDGTYAIEVAGRTAGFNGVKQSLLDITNPNTLYRISGKVQMGAGEADDSIKVQLIKDNGSGQVFVDLYTLNPATAVGWQEFIAVFSYPETDLTTLELSIHGPTNVSAIAGPDLAIFLVDNCLLEEVAPSLPILNGGFEDTAAGPLANAGSSGIGWNNSGGTTLTVVTSPTPFEGSNALEVSDRDAGFDGVQYYNANLDPSYSYLVTGAARNVAAGSDTIIFQSKGVKEDGAGYFGPNVNIDVTDTGWTEFSIVLTVPTNLKTMGFTFKGSATNTAASFLLDGVDISITSTTYASYQGFIVEDPLFTYTSATAILNYAAGGYDLDKDGLSNFFEYLFVYDPLVADAPGGARSFIDNSAFTLGTDRVVSFSFPVREGATDYLAEIEESSDLTTWGPPAETQTTTSGSVSGGARQTTVDTTILGPHPTQEFYRLNLDVTP